MAQTGGSDRPRGNIKQDWRDHMSYEEMHVKYFSPSNACGCETCDRGREWELAQQEIDAR